MARLVARQRQRDGIGRAHRASPLLERLARRRLWSWRAAASAPRCRFGERPAKISPTQSALTRAMAAEELLALGGEADDLHAAVVRRAAAARIRPCSASRSTRPVMLPFDTIMRCDNSPSVMPFGARSSCASRSKRGSVMSNCVAQPAAHLVLDQGRAGEQPQPQPQLGLVVVGPLGTLVSASSGMSVRVVHQISPPADHERRAGDGGRLRRAEIKHRRRDLLRLDQPAERERP